MKITKKIISLSAALVMTMSAITTGAYAAQSTVNTSAAKTYSVSAYSTSSSKTVTANKAMSLALDAGASGYSNTVTFNFNSLPSNAIVKDITVNAGTGKSMGGLGAVGAWKLKVTSPKYEEQEYAWGRGNVTKVTGFTAEKAKGIWSAAYYGINAASANGGPRFVGGTKYSSPKMTITYILE